MTSKQMSLPPDLENMLLEFTINVIVENPQDLVSYAADYFTRLFNEKKAAEAKKKDEPDEEGSKEHIEKMLGGRTMRRGTVMGERYNPEEDEEDDVEVYPKTDEQRKRIRKEVEGVFLFRVLDDNDLVAVIDAMIPKPIKKHEVVIKQGDDGDYFYLIEKGYFDIFIKDNKGKDKFIGAYENSGFFGELALLHNQPRAATITATSDGFLWAVDRKTFNKLIVKRAFQKRQAYIKLIENTPQLKALTDYEKMQVADALQGQLNNEGDIIVKEGDEGNGMYFIVEGKVSVRQKLLNDETKDKELCQLTKGQFFGEMAIVRHQPRAATVIALDTPTKLAFLDVKAFERLLGPCMDIMERHIETYK